MFDKLFNKKNDDSIIVTITHRGITNKITVKEDNIQAAIHKDSNPMIAALSKFIFKRCDQFISNPFEIMCDEMGAEGKMLKDMLNNIDEDEDKTIH